MPVQYTIDQVKEDLPPVLVRINGQIYPGQIFGRKLAHPIVFIKQLNKEIEYSWHAVTRAANGEILQG